MLLNKIAARTLWLSSLEMYLVKLSCNHVVCPLAFLKVSVLTQYKSVKVLKKGILRFLLL